jgi:hypothetical protein
MIFQTLLVHPTEGKAKFQVFSLASARGKVETLPPLW